MTPVRSYPCALAWIFVFALLLVSPPTVSWAQPAKSPVKPPVSSQEALILYGDAANFQNKGEFDLAAEEWGGFLKRFPKDPLASKAQHYLGVCQLQLKRFDKAAAAFQAVIDNYPEFDLLEDAYQNLGWCQYSMAGQNVDGMYAKAAATFTEMAKKFPAGKYTDQALFFLGEAEYNQGNRKQASAAYQQLVKAFPKSDLRCDALYALGVAQEELGEYAAAGTVYDVFLRDCADSKLVTEVRMRKAETVLQAEGFEEAEKIFAEVSAVEGFKSADHAVFRRAYCLSKLDRFADAGGVYGDLVKTFPDSVYVAEATMAAGRCFYRAEQFDQAQTWLQSAVKAAGEEAPEAAHWLCRIYLQDGQPQKAAKLAAAVLPGAGQSPYAVNLQIDQADALFEQADSKKKAAELYLKIAQDNPEHELAPQALYNAAFTEMESKQYAPALKHVAEFLTSYADDPLATDVRFVAGESQLQQADYPKATETFRELVASHPQHQDAETWTLRLALALYLQKQYGQVVDALAGAVGGMKGKDGVAEAQFLIGSSQFLLKKDDEAIAALQASLRANPTWRQSDEAMLFLSRALRRKEQSEQAVQTVSKLIQDFPNSRLLDQAYYRLGEYHYDAAAYDAAVEAYGQVLADWPESTFAAYAQYGLGWSNFKKKAFTEAAESFTAMLTDHADHELAPDAQFARAMCRRQLKQYQEAIVDIDAFLTTNPDAEGAADALYERGLDQVQLKQFAPAAASFEKLLEANPKYADADKVLYEIGWACKSDQDANSAAKAVAAFGRLAREYPDSTLAPEANFHVGESQYDDGKYKEALASYTTANKTSGQGELNEKSLYKLGWSQFQLKDYQAALAAFTQQAKDYPDGAFHADGVFMQAECNYRLENYEQALPAYQAALEGELPLETLTVLALLHAGQSASQLKQWDEAAKLLAQILEKHPDSPSVAEAYYELGWAKQNADSADEALAAYSEATTRARATRPDVSARARFMMGEVHFNRKEFAEAIRHFQRVMLGYGGEDSPDKVKPWQAKSGYEAGRCVDVQIQQAPPAEQKALIEQAKRFYGYVVENHAEDALAKQAQTRLESLSKL